MFPVLSLYTLTINYPNLHICNTYNAHTVRQSAVFTCHAGQSAVLACHAGQSAVLAKINVYAESHIGVT